MIFITGDTHIPIDISKLGNKYFPEQKNLSKKDYLIICGDFGGVWNGSNEEKYWRTWLNKRNFTTLFVDGNHENFELLKTYKIEEWNGGKVHFIHDSIIHLMRGQVYDIDGLKFFTMGGGNSIDKFYRTPYVSWWPDEMPSKKEYDEALENLEKHNNIVDYIITHVAPESIMSMVHPDNVYEKPLNLFLEEINKTVSFNKWYIGHLHLNKEWDEKHFLLYDRIIDLNNNYFKGSNVFR